MENKDNEEDFEIEEIGCYCDLLNYNWEKKV